MILLLYPAEFSSKISLTESALDRIENLSLDTLTRKSDLITEELGVVRDGLDTLKTLATQRSLDTLRDKVTALSALSLLGDTLELEHSNGSTIIHSSSVLVQAGPADVVSIDGHYTVDPEPTTIKIQFPANLNGFGGPDFNGLSIAGIEAPILNVSFESDVPGFSADRVAFQEHGVSVDFAGLFGLGGKQITLKFLFATDQTILTLLLDKLDTEVSSRSSQSSVNALETKLNTLETSVSSRASQAGLTALHETVSAQLDAPVRSRASQASLDLVRTILDQQEKAANEFRDLALRAQIERQLADGNSRVSLFYLPDIRGGQLEFIRDIVADTILINRTAGIDVGTSPQQLLKGNESLAQGNYKQAYDHYAKAYQTVVK